VSIADPNPRGERPRDVREPIDEGRFEPLWVICKGGTIGGHAILRDLSKHGMKIGVDRRAWRLIAAFEQARGSGATVEVFRIPRDRHVKARVVWMLRDVADEVSFGLELTEPLGGSTV
jgi:hypothetical protein